MNWVNSARAICAESGHLDVCDSHIGQMLAKEPEQENADWPGIATRDVIDEIDSEALTRGFEVGIHNKRGVYSKSIGEGGAQERTLAGRYEKYAQNCEMEWPVTAAALRRVAKAYEAESEREDERADRWD